MTRVEFTLSGCANGHPVLIDGQGHVEANAVRFDSVGHLLRFDPALARLAGFDAVEASLGDLVAAHEVPVAARCRTDFLGDGGTDAGTIVAHATVERRNDSVRCVAQMSECRIDFEVGERITAIEQRVLRVVACGEGVTLVSTATIATSRGRSWSAISTTYLTNCDPGKNRATKLDRVGAA
ncbi:MAG: hypothetical protein R3F29_04635 [Planctomycetota bacterium]